VRVLIVDDQVANLILLESLVKDFGYDVITTSDGQEVLEKFSLWSPDIVLLDVMMPKLNGYQIAPKLKALSGNVHVPIIFITALDEQATLLRCLSVGGDDFVHVPVDPVVLQAKLNAHRRVRELSQILHEKNRSLAWHSARIEREHTIVEHIFRNALSRNYLDYEHIETHLKPATMFSGDLCLVAIGPLGNVYVFLGDFTGHGLAPATGALPLSQAFFTMTERGVGIAEMATEFNQRLLELLPDDMFCAAILLEVAASGDRLTYWNGGMPPAMVINDLGKITAHLHAQHMALGILEAQDFDSRVTNIGCDSSQRVLLYTDGVIETQNEFGEILGIERLEQLVTAKAGVGVHDIVTAMDRFRGDGEAQDDVSLALLRCHPSEVAPEPVETDTVRLPFELTVTIGVDEMKHAEPVTTLMNSLSQLPALRVHRGTIFMLISEAYNNALDHGLLKLDSGLKNSPDGFQNYYQTREQRLQDLAEGEIKIRLKYSPKDNFVEIQVSDSGAGTVTQNEPDSSDVHGRGIKLLKELTDFLEWSEDSRTVRFGFKVA